MHNCSMHSPDEERAWPVQDQVDSRCCANELSSFRIALLSVMKAMKKHRVGFYKSSYFSTISTKIVEISKNVEKVISDCHKNCRKAPIFSTIFL